MDTRSATTRVIDAARVTGAGSVAWHNLINSDSSTDKGRLISATTGGAGAVIAAYNVGSGGNTDIAANRVNADGTQGTPPCYANCDGSTASPILNVQDFTCFLQRFAAAAPYANCDGSTSSPILNVQDFTCFLQNYAAGCN
jgi:hypothetical protein